MSIYAFSIPTNSEQFGWRLYPGYFSKEECAQLIEDMKDQETWIGGVVKSDKELQSEVNPDVRNVSIKTVSHAVCPWVFDKLNQLVWGVNQHYQYDLTGFMEQMQLLHYGEDINGGHYHLHQDHGPGPLSTRKLTIIVQLSEETDYEGCETHVTCSGVAPKGIGDVIVFPSYTPHQVTPLTKGSRDALVVWVNGPPFR